MMSGDAALGVALCESCRRPARLVAVGCGDDWFAVRAGFVEPVLLELLGDPNRPPCCAAATPSAGSVQRAPQRPGRAANLMRAFAGHGRVLLTSACVTGNAPTAAFCPLRRSVASCPGCMRRFVAAHPT